MAGLTKEETVQEALINWVLAGGTCHGLISELVLFAQGLAEIDKFEDGGTRAKALDNLKAAIEGLYYFAVKVDRAGIPELPPHLKPAAPTPLLRAPVQVLVESFDGVVSQVRASATVQVSLWERGEVREGFIPTVLLNLPVQPIKALREE